MITNQDAASLVRWIISSDADFREQYPDGYLRIPFPCEAELFGFEEILGVVGVGLDGSGFDLFAFTSWAELENHCAEIDVTLGDPVEVAKFLDCTLFDLGVMRGIK